MKIPPGIVIGLVTLTLLGAGCLDLPPEQKIADTLAPTDKSRAAVAQDLGFGMLPKPQYSNMNSGNGGIVRINAELPSLQPTVTVVRVPAGMADRTQFANLTTAMDVPAGAVGDNARNLSLDFVWTNDEGYVWSYKATNKRLAFSNPSMAPSAGASSTRLEDEKIVRAARDFVVGHGFKESDYRNFTSASSTDQSGLAIVTAERVADERNIVDKDGHPELGCALYLNATNGKVVSGWLAMAPDAQRSNYPAISASDMKTRMENGGLAGPTAGSVDIDKVFFAFVSLTKQNDHDFEYLAPALVGEGTEHLVQGGSRPYRIVVPLLK